MARLYAVPTNHLKAVIEVESAGGGFLIKEPAPARPKILFERHIFYKLTPKPVSKTRPDLSWPTWDKSFYKGGSAEWDRLKDAMKFDPEKALMSASWGLGQIMGMNYKQAGCDTIKTFVEEEFTSEYYQLLHMLRFIKSNGLLTPLQKGNWAAFAKGYNGPAYKSNQYDTKLANAARG